MKLTIKSYPNNPNTQLSQNQSKHCHNEQIRKKKHRLKILFDRFKVTSPAKVNNQKQLIIYEKFIFVSQTPFSF